MGRLRRIAWRIAYVEGPRLASWLRRRWLQLCHPHAHIEFQGPVYLGPGFSVLIPDAGTLIVGPGVEFRRGFRAEIHGDGRLVIGAGSVFTYDVLVQCTTSIEIGERCIFAQASMLVDGSHRFRDVTKPVLAQGYDFRAIRIGDDATISAKCTVIADVGERAFIGANSVVTRPVPPFTVAAGVPARVIDEFGPAGRVGT
jgi:acetyltransferase-like isoleucine patch superfamily enzyme